MSAYTTRKLRPGDTVALDFDGTIHDYSDGWTGVEPTGGPIPGAIEFIEGLLADGLAVEIYSARALDPGGAQAISGWLDRHGFPPLIVSTVKGSHYVAFVDDRAVSFRGDYAETRAALDRLLDHPKWWRDVPEGWRVWTSPAGVEHAIDQYGRCVTCGRVNHPKEA